MSIPGEDVRRYPDRMAHDTDRQDASAPAEVGTPEGLQAARALLDEGRDRMTDADWRRLQERYGRRERRAA